MSNDDVRENVHEAAAAVLERFPESAFVWSHGQPVVYVDRGVWSDLGRFLRDEQQFTQCVDITAVDHLLRPDRTLPPGITAGRFEVVANYLSHARVVRLRAIAQVDAEQPEIATLADVYPGLEYAEREVYDLYGITFTGHPDLTRILMPDDWTGYPLRKDFPAARVPVQFKDAPRPR